MAGVAPPGAGLFSYYPPPGRWRRKGGCRPCACFLELPLRPEPEGLLEPFGISRPHLRIDDAGRALAVERHDELLGGNAAHIGARFARHARGVGARDHVVEL